MASLDSRPTLISRVFPGMWASFNQAASIFGTIWASFRSCHLDPSTSPCRKVPAVSWPGFWGLGPVTDVPTPPLSESCFYSPPGPLFLTPFPRHTPPSLFCGPDIGWVGP